MYNRRSKIQYLLITGPSPNPESQKIRTYRSDERQAEAGVQVESRSGQQAGSQITGEQVYRQAGKLAGRLAGKPTGEFSGRSTQQSGRGQSIEAAYIVNETGGST